MRSEVVVAGLYVGSVLVHGALWLAVVRVRPPAPPPPPPIKVTLRELPPEPKPTPPPPEPTPEPAPEVIEEAVAPEPTAPEPPKAEPTPRPKAPTPKPPSDPPPTPAAPSPPSFGIELGNGGSGPGLAVPSGDPGGAPGGGGAPRKASPPKPKILAAKSEPAKSECAEDEVKPKALELPSPEYTAAARDAGIAGKVRVKVTIDEDGNPTDVQVVESLHPELDSAAIASVEKAKFEPGLRCGVATRMTIKISIRFSL